MNEGRKVRALKGVLLLLAFAGITLSILFQPDRGAIGYLHRIGVHAEGMAVWFGVAAVMNGVIGITYRKWNGLWFAPFFMYTGMTWIALFRSDTNPPMVSGFAYSLLSAFLVIELLDDLGVFDRGGKKDARGCC